ncbi:uncharacterized protein [Spinacia oleracea]|uniref:Uncharacterized protein n=1 Tax=Spinacia oleracea TaxID=3562 RepID=A0ABM3QV79_SPIOL|nr:uncharacterized protein LOC110787051 [Spinacia oleracea]
MTGKIVIRSSEMTQTPPSGTLPPPETPVRTRKKSLSNVGEVAGGTAANCVVVSCCCPCVLMEFFILAVYKVPASVCRRVWRKKRQKVLMKKKKRFLEEAKEVGCSSVGEAHNKSYVDELSDVDWKALEMIKVSTDGSAVELDRQMWDQFSNMGFWRSPSQRHNVSDVDQ